MIEKRPDPEKLLKLVQEEERQKEHGKLKIYLGAAPGVGKTYSMLEEAISQREQGLDVVVGIVESHGRREIESLKRSLEILPLQLIDYRGKQLSEFDLDAALKRSPSLILIDEMAHNNVPAQRHPKRWQDIKEILDHGIDVYTTLNVQHIESLNDVVEQITHAPIRETIPDSMLELANAIELIDLPPEDLLKRLQEGKVYFPEQAELAKEHFFRKGNLLALRELALRVVAERVGTQALLYREDQGIKDIWPIKEKILVCVGHTIASTKLIRDARRMATHLQAEWVAVYVDTPLRRLSEEQRNSAIQNLKLAEQLGAKTRILSGFDIVREVINYAHEQNVTQIVIGKRLHFRWRDFLSKNLLNEIVQHSGEIDVHIITYKEENFETPLLPPSKRSIPWQAYGVSINIIALATLIDYLIYPYLGSNNLIMVYVLAVTIVALLGKKGPSILASVLSVIAYNFFFIPPFFNFTVLDIQYLFTLIVMLFVTQVISYLTVLAHSQVEEAHLTEHHAATLHTFNYQLANTRNIDKLLDTSVRYIADTFDSEVMVLLPENGHLVVRSKYNTQQILNDKEQSVAQWVYSLGQLAGLGTDTLSFSEALYVPLLASGKSIGVLRVCPTHSKHLFTPEQIHLLEAYAIQVAFALENITVQKK